MKATWNNTLIAESDNTIVVEGNHYFPKESIKEEFFSSSQTQTICPWKGTAHYYTISANGAENTDAAWSYPDPKEAAHNIKGYIAFWNGVVISE